MSFFLMYRLFTCPKAVVKYEKRYTYDMDM